MAYFACCKTRPIPAYYICENCLNIYHRACALKNKNKFKFLTDHKLQCCELTKQTDDEISVLEQTIEELNDETQAKNRYIERQNKEMKVMMQEALRQEEETNQLIARLEKELVEANVKITELDGIINSIINTEKNTIAVQTNPIKYTSKDTQTTSTVTTCNISQTCNNIMNYKKTGNINDTVEHKGIPKLLIVAGSLGRNLSKIITKQTIKYQCQVIIKPGAPDMEIVKTALINANNFTKRDIVIIWTSQLHIKIIDDFILKSSHTNPIVLTKPYQYGENERKNNRTYQDNIYFLKNLCTRCISMKHLIECNAVLRRSNYTANGQYIRYIGKWFIVKKIITHIENYFVEEEDKQAMIKIVNYKVKHIPKDGDEQKRSINFTTQVNSTKNCQLYPDLQEISLLESREQVTLGRNLLDEIANSTLEEVTSVCDLSAAPVQNKNFLVGTQNVSHTT